MKPISLVLTLAFCAGLFHTVNAAPQGEVKRAAQKLSDQGNYSWTTTLEMGADSRWRPGPTHGKADQDGLVCLAMTFGENTMEMFMKGKKGAYKTEEGWEAIVDPDAGSAEEQGRARFMGRFAQNFKAPAAQAAELLTHLKELKQNGDAYEGELTAEGAESMMRFGRRRAEGGPSIRGAKGTAKFWVQDGVLVKYQYHVTGTMTFNDNDREVDTTATVEIKDIGTTKIEVPAAAKEKMS